MGAIWFTGSEFIAALSEMLGFKTGLALTEERLHAMLDEIDSSIWPPSADVQLRIRSEEFEELFAGLLHHLGAGPPRPIVSPILTVLRRYENDPSRREVVEALSKDLVAFLSASVEAPTPSAGIDPTPFLQSADHTYGDVGLEIATELLMLVNAQLFQNPFNSMRRTAWSDIRQLDELFHSELLETSQGEYFDQRFIDFLAANFEDIDRINWRQFEGLAAEFFGRLGFGVALGPGRNDNGVDIRLWPSAGVPLDEPAAVLVQCKRERRAISKGVVKALWADVVHEHATSGLVVTTSSFSPGAAAVRTARGYPIQEANRENLRAWIQAMRSPGAGVFLGD